MRAGWASVPLATSLACASVTRRVDPVSVLSRTESEVYRSPERAFLMLAPSWPYVDVKLVEASDCAVERTTTYEATETAERHSEGLPLVDLGNGGSGLGDALVFLAAVGGPMAADAAISSGAERANPRETTTMLTRRRVRLEPNYYAPKTIAPADARLASLCRDLGATRDP